MEHFPLFIRLTERSCLVVGGGQVALRKVHALQRSGARLTLLAPTLCDPLQELIQADGVTHLPRSFHPDADESELIRGAFLVVAATDDDACNHAIAEQCERLGVHCNVASDAAAGDLVLPAIIDRSPVVVALNSGGASPTVTRYLKRQLEAFLPASLGQMALWAEQWRSRVKQRLSDIKLRQRLWDRVLSGLAASHVSYGNQQAADNIIEQHLGEAERGVLDGEVFLVGAGPGDPDLLTLKALRLIQQADVVLYDRLVSEPIMSLLPKECERIYVGKRQADHAVPQQDINQLLVDLARQGRNVLRLKGGDPFIFGRGGEEIEKLAGQGVPFQVVPGITAASGCASYAGIPLTHRDYAQSVRFVTGHLQNNETNLEWPELARGGQTLVFYMGLSGLPAICQALQQYGRQAETPAAIVERGTTPDQRVLTGTLESLPEIVAGQKVKAPTLLIVGEVVQLQSQLSWFHP
jgi:uroporphyrin-III C-methyltransferase/precorrin-2 dehydrogenase/sirohydrochlorin ferrochelatase